MLVMGGVPATTAGPLEQLLTREASRLARDQGEDIERASWKALRQLEPGSDIVITTVDAVRSGKLIATDDASIQLSHNGVIEQIGADTVRLIERRLRRGSARAAVFGTLGGIWLGSGLAVGVVSSTACRQHCVGAAAAAWGGLLGVPILTGYGAWRGTSRVVSEVVYLRP
jgi:hypothetical protein